MNVPGWNEADVMDAIERSFDELCAEMPPEVREGFHRDFFLPVFSAGFAKGMHHGRDLTIRYAEEVAKR